LVVGSHNELAHAAALAVIDNLGSKYNPLFIYGGVGLGKTHLMQALGNTVKTNNKKINIWYINTERLVNDIIGSIREQTIDEVKKQYKKIDLLLIDDIQFIANKEKTQEEVFHIFNVLYEANKQIVFTSDRPPKAIPGLEERLRSRFEGGMVADIGLPNYETRVAILKNKLKDKKSNLPEEIIDYIAQNITNNVRELEGALNTLLINFEVKKINPSIELSKKLLEDFIKKPKKTVTPLDVLKVVSVFYDISLEKIKSDSRRKDLVKARQITMYVLRELVKLSYPAIGEVFNNKDHTTVMHSCKKIEEEKTKDSVLNSELEAIIEKLSYDVFN
jgi:chromosomal replication initiator protein